MHYKSSFNALIMPCNAPYKAYMIYCMYKSYEGWGETPPHDCKALWVYSNTQESAI